MKSRAKARQKATIAYLSVVILLTVLLFSLGIGSIVREKQRLDKLSNMNVLGPTLAAEVTKQAWESANDCLNDPVVRMMVGSLAGTHQDVQPEHGRRWLGEISRHYPMVDHFFIIKRGQLIFPLASREGAQTPSVRRKQPSPERAETVLASAAEKPHFQKPTASPICFDVVPIGSDLHQMFHTSLRASDESVTYGFEADTNWAREVLLPECVQMVGLTNVVLPDLKTNPVLLGLKPGRNEFHFPLQDVFPFLEISIPHGYVETRAAASRRDMVYLILANFFFVAVIGIGTVLGGRAMRELRSQRIENDFFSAFSHELKNPLTIIQLYTETLLRNDSLSKRTRSTYYRIINRESESLGQLLESLLALARYEKGRCQYHLVQGDLVETLRARVNGYAEHLKLRGFHVVIALADNLPLVNFDRDAVNRAVLSLMDNARKYSGDARFMRVAAFARKREVVIEVEDHGVGVPPEERPKLFDGFYRGTSTAEKKGFGIGLYMVRQIMDSHGGRVELESQVGVGSIFRLVFAAARAPLARGASLRSSSPGANSIDRSGQANPAAEMPTAGSRRGSCQRSPTMGVWSIPTASWTLSCVPGTDGVPRAGGNNEGHAV